MGSPTVLIGNMPAARMGDMAICVGPPDTIVMGCPTVLIGEAGGGGAGAAGAAVGASASSFAVKTKRRGGLLGAIVGGIVGAVVVAVAGAAIGGLPGAIVGGVVGAMTGAAAGAREVTTYGDSIVIEGSPEYRATVVEDLNQLSKETTGKKLLEAYSGSGHTLIIRPISPGGVQGNDSCAPVDSADAMIGTDGKTPMKGSNSIIEYNPTLEMNYTAENGSTQTMPPDHILGHEMIHGLHNANGENRRNFPDSLDPNDNQEEARTIGVHGYEKEIISERGFSNDAGRSPRPNHNAVSSMTYQDKTGQWHEGHYDASGNWVENLIPPRNNRPNH